MRAFWIALNEDKPIVWALIVALLLALSAGWWRLIWVIRHA
jgi:hypothetical protein